MQRGADDNTDKACFSICLFSSNPAGAPHTPPTFMERPRSHLFPCQPAARPHEWPLSSLRRHRFWLSVWMWYFTQNKAHSWGYPHNKDVIKPMRHSKNLRHTANARLLLTSIPEETSLGAITTTVHSLVDSPEEFILLQSLFYCFSSGGIKNKKSFQDAEGCH